MIPGLLHGRAGAAPAGGIIASPAYLPRFGFAFGTSSAAATSTFTINPDGSWTSTGTGYTDESGNWYLPTTPGAGAAYDVRITLTLLSGSGAVITNPAAAWVAANVARTLQAVIQRFTGGTSKATYSALVEFRPAGGGVAVSSSTFNLDVEAGVGSGGGGCPTLDMVLPDGRRAEDINAGDMLLLCDPVTGEEIFGDVTCAETKLQPCVELTAENGARFRCSTSAPMATTVGEIKALDLLGYTAVLKVDGVRQALKVVEVYDLGMQLVRHITVNPQRHSDDRYFWVGGGDGTDWLHHNVKHDGGN